MRPLLKATAAFVKIPEYYETPVGDNSKLIDGTVGDFYNEIAFRAHLNLTLESGTEAGSCNKTALCNGIIGLVQRNEADFTLIPVYLNSFDYRTKTIPVIVGPVSGEIETAISSKIFGNGISNESVDVLTTFLALDWSIWLTLSVFGFLICFVIKTFGKISTPKVKQTVWQMIRITLGMGFDDRLKYSSKSILVSFTLLIFWIIQFHSCMFTTNIIIKPKKDNIDSLQDLLNSNSTSFWIQIATTYTHFKYASNSLYKSIWNKADDQRLISEFNMQKNCKILNWIHNGRVLIHPTDYLMLLRRMSCSSFFGNRTSGAHHISKERFLITGFAPIFNANISQEIRDRLENVYSSLMEAGHFLAFRASLPAIYVPDDMLGPYPEFLSCLREDEEQTNNENESILSLTSNQFIYTFVLFGACLCFSLITLQVENVKAHKHTSKRKRASKMVKVVARLSHTNFTFSRN